MRGTIAAIRAVPGLVALILFQTFNNLLGGVFMALMDAYGLLLVSVQVWGFLWGFLSLGFIVGGLIVVKRGLGANPLRTMLLANVAMWSVTVVFPLRPSIVLLTAGMAVWLTLIPLVEAAEQTILQKVVPPQRQGRVFGFAQSVEQAATPITAFLIGPIAQFIFIPFMTTGAGVELLGPWFGTGTDRGLALLFTVAGALGLVATLLALRSGAYRRLSAHYQQPGGARPGPAGTPAGGRWSPRRWWDSLGRLSAGAPGLRGGGATGRSRPAPRGCYRTAGAGRPRRQRACHEQFSRVPAPLPPPRRLRRRRSAGRAGSPRSPPPRWPTPSSRPPCPRPSPSWCGSRMTSTPSASRTTWPCLSPRTRGWCW